MNFCSFIIEYYIKENELFCSIEIEDGAKEGLEYAFYLLLNGNKIATKYYTVSNKTSFQLTNDGKYQIMAFVRKDEEKIIKKTDVIEFIFDERYPIINLEHKQSPIQISIFGSCVTRDILEYDTQKKLKLETYIARQSIVSAMSKPVEINKDYIRLESNFKKEVIYNDFMKNNINLFEKDKSKFLLIDLIDERFKLAKVNNGESLVTYSSELIESGYLENPILIDKKKCLFNKRKYQIDNMSLKKYIQRFADRILEIYDMECIIIHKCIMKDKYINLQGETVRFDKNYLMHNRKINDVLDYMYDYLQLYLSKAKVIDITDSYLADENHKWGLAPMHYQREYYIKVLDEVKNYIKNFEC